MLIADQSFGYSAARPGRRLLVREEASIPFYWLTLVAIVQERSPLAPLERFVLRAVLTGLSKPDDVAGFLGVDRLVLDRTLVDLWHDDLIDLRPGEATGRTVVLTPRGREGAETAATLKTELQKIYIAFDRLIWEVAALPESRLMRPRDARAHGLRPMDPHRGGQPSTKDLPLSAVRAALEVRGILSADPGERTKDLIAIRAVSRAENLYQSADLLAYGPETEAVVPIDTTDLEIAIGIEGHVSARHSLAFAATPQHGHLIQEIAEPPPPLEVAVPIEIAQTETPLADVVELQAQLAVVEDRLHRTERVQDSAAIEGEPPSSEIATSADELRRQRDDLREQLAGIQFRQLFTWELADTLREARYRSQRRLLIISPWISGEVVDAEFIQSLGRLVSNGVSIHIGYGFPGEDGKNNHRAVSELERLARRSAGRLILCKIGTTHEKVLIFDDSMVTASFNWLSFKGDRKMALRRESGTLVHNKAFVDEQYAAYVDVIDRPGGEAQ